MVTLEDVQAIQTEVTDEEREKYRALTVPQLRLKLRMANFYIHTLRQLEQPPELKAPAIEKYRNHAAVINQVLREKNSDSEKPDAIHIQGKPAKMTAKRF